MCVWLKSTACTMNILHRYCSNRVSSPRLCVVIKAYTQAQYTHRHGVSSATALLNTSYTQVQYVNNHILTFEEQQPSPSLSFRMKMNSLLHNLPLRFFFFMQAIIHFVLSFCQLSSFLGQSYFSYASFKLQMYRNCVCGSEYSVNHCSVTVWVIKSSKCKF